jgi:alcohol dehydrogenase
MSILLPHGLEYNFYKIEPMLAQLLWALSGKEVYDNTPAENRGKATIAEIRKMNRLLNEITDGRHGEKFCDLKNREGEFMVTKDRFNQIAHTALGDASIVYNPEELRLDDILDILEKSY